MDRAIAGYRRHGLCLVLDASGMDTAAMGFARWHAGWAAARDSQLLDEHILVRFGGGVGGSAGVGGMAEIAQNDFSGTSPGSRRRYSRAGQQPAL